MTAADESDAPAVSVIIPTYNADRFLGLQLEALCGQTCSVPWELIVVDNGSTDRSLEVANSFSERLPIRVVSATEDQGAAYARNAGANVALGELLVYCDADDVVAAGWLAAMIAESEGYDMVGGAIDATQLNSPDLLPSRGREYPDTTLSMGPGHFLPYAVSANVAMSRTVLMSLGGWAEQLPFCEDVELSWRALLAGYTLGFAGGATVNYRFRDSVRSSYRQTREYCTAEVLLYRMFRDKGMRRPQSMEVLTALWWLASRLPFTIANRRRRHSWAVRVAVHVGRLRGSLRYRVWYP